MSVKEARRYEVLKRVQTGELGQVQAAQELRLSVRQIKRLCKAVREGGTTTLISKRRGVPSNRKLPTHEKARIVAIVQAQYADFGPTLAGEYLRKHHGLAASTETLRGWMVGPGLWQAKTRRIKHVHSPRPRRSRPGELVQIDGSHHAWFEDRGAVCCLSAFIDDATGRVLGARFTPTETTQAYFDVLLQCVQTHGMPLALYSDRHSIFTKHDPQDPKPRGAWSGSFKPCKTAYAKPCACRASAPLSRPINGSQAIWQNTTSALQWPHAKAWMRTAPGAGQQRHCSAFVPTTTSARSAPA